MKHRSYNNRRIFWESKTKQIWVILGLFLFVAVAIWTKDKTSSLTFWGSIILFGGGGLFMLIQLINPNNLFVSHDSELGKQILADRFQKMKEDLGFFAYTNMGFNLSEYKGVTHYYWSDIETIFGFKEDHFTSDEICMDIFFSNKNSIRLTESTPGWYQFNKRLIQSIPTINENWDTEITQPAFATNMTLLYDKNGRTKEQSEIECYGD